MMRISARQLARCLIFGLPTIQKFGSVTYVDNEISFEIKIKSKQNQSYFEIYNHNTYFLETIDLVKVSDDLIRIDNNGRSLEYSHLVDGSISIRFKDTPASWEFISIEPDLTMNINGDTNAPSIDRDAGTITYKWLTVESAIDPEYGHVIAVTGSTGWEIAFVNINNPTKPKLN